MKDPAAQIDGFNVPFRSIGSFLLMTFALAWGIVGLYVFLPDAMSAIFGQLSGSHPLFYLAVYSPALAAFVLVGRHTGVLGLKRFAARFFIWRCSKTWYAFLLVGIPLAFIAGAALNGNLFREPFPFDTLPAMLMGLLLAAIKGPVEEFGWRGFALPLLQRRFVPFAAALILGAIWGIWHAPAFLLSGTPQSEWSFAVFFGGCLAISIIATALYNDSNGSILLAALFHFTLMNPVFPDAQPYDSLLLGVVALLVAGWKRQAMFSPEGAVVEVVPPEPGQRGF